MDENLFNEQEIDLIDLFWRILEQWRGLLVAGIVFAIFISGVIYVGSGVVAASEVAEVTEETSTEDKYQQACTALSQYANYMLAKDSYSNSIFNMNNFNDSIKVTCSYQISVSDETSDMYTLTSLYSNMSLDDDFLGSMVSEAEKYWEGVNSKTITEIMQIIVSQDMYSRDPRKGMISISFNLPADTDIDTWQNTLTKAINAYHNKISSVSGGHTVRPVLVNSMKMDNSALTKKQNDTYTTLINSKNTYDKTYSSLGKDDQALVDEVISEGDGSYDIEDYIGSLDKKLEELKTQAADTTTTAPVEKKFSVKYLILGFIVGIFAYACAYLAFFVLIRLVRGEDDLHGATGLRNFGGVYDYPYIGKLACLLHDPSIYKKRTRKTKDIRTISDDIVSKLQFIDVKDFTLISVGRMSDKTTRISDEQIKYLGEHGINAKLLNIPDSADNVRDSVFTDMDNVIIELLGNRTLWNDLGKVYAKLKEYNVNVIGSEYVEM